MRHLLLLLLTATALFSQAQQINGLAKDESGDPLSGATVSLTKASDSSTIKLAVTKARGRVKRVQKSGGVIGSN